MCATHVKMTHLALWTSAPLCGACMARGRLGLALLPPFSVSTTTAWWRLSLNH